jgi:hypothetical protein
MINCAYFLIGDAIWITRNTVVEDPQRAIIRITRPPVLRLTQSLGVSKRNTS